MSTTLAPVGLKPVAHLTGAVVRPQQGTIASGYASNIFFGSPVVILADGTLGIGADRSTNRLVGSFAGCEYTAADGRRRVSNYWPASTTATEIIAFYYADPDIIYEIQADGSITQAQVGALLSFGTGSNEVSDGSTSTGLSTAAANVGTSPTQLQVIGFNRDPDNAAGDTYTKVHVIIAQHQFRANVSAF
jgi:hypothetical protein